MNKFARVLVPASLALSALGAKAAAAGPDTSAITDAAANVGVIGAAVFAVYVAVKGFKWIRAAL